MKNGERSSKMEDGAFSIKTLLMKFCISINKSKREKWSNMELKMQVL